MRAFALAALLAAIATPTWAANDAELDAIELCLGTHDNTNICIMKYSPENEARRFAKSVLFSCLGAERPNPMCARDRRLHQAALGLLMLRRKPEPVDADEVREAVLQLLVDRFGDRPLTWEAATMSLALAAFEIKQVALFAPRGTEA